MDDRQRSMRLAQYLGYLVGTVRLRGTTLSAVMNGLCKIMIATGQQMTFFESDIISTTRRSLRLTERERIDMVTSNQGRGESDLTTDDTNGRTNLSEVLGRGHRLATGVYLSRGPSG